MTIGSRAQWSVQQGGHVPVMTAGDLVNALLERAFETASEAADGEPSSCRSAEHGAGCVAVGHGACGVAHVLTHVGREVPARLTGWIRSQSLAATEYPPGLMTGLAGIAWTLGDLGFANDARRLMARAFRHPRLFETAGVHRGSSGIGMAALWMYARTNEREYLAQACQIGEHVSAAGHHGPASYAYGASGVAAFLLYLYLSTGEWKWLKVGQEALELDMERSASLSDGVAGIVARYYAVLGRRRYEAALQAMVERASWAGVRGLGYFDGLAGIGQCFLDLAILCRSAAAERAAIRIAQAIATRVDPALTTDFGAGAAGVALFLHRVRARQTSSFMLDELFDGDRLQTLVAGGWEYGSDIAPRARGARP